MIRRLMKWSASIAVNAIVFFIAAFASQAQTVSQPTTTGYFGQSEVQPGLDTMIQQGYGSGDLLNLNLIQPMLTGQPLSTVNGQNSFTAQLFCPSTKQFLQILVHPSTTGDLDSMILQEDIGFTGTSRYVFLLPPATAPNTTTLISGVCANGWISCDAGTWNNCVYYKWTADSSGRVGVQLSNTDALGGCFCINNSCGSGLVNSDMAIILQTLGGGAVGAVQQSNAHIAVTDSTINTSVITYYAQDTNNCSLTGSGSTSGDPSQYYNGGTGSSMDAAATSEAGAQLSDAKSLYSTMLTSQAMSNNTTEYKTCSVIKTLDANTSAADPTYTFLPWLDLTVHMYMGRDSDNLITYTVSVDTNSDGIYDRTDTSSEGPGVISCDQTGYEGWRPILQARLDNLVSQYQTQANVPVTDIQPGAPASTLGESDGGGRRCTANEEWINDYLMLKKSPPICPTGYTFLATDVKCYQESDSISIADTCAALQADNSCTKKEEIDDGVFVFRDYQTTGLAPLASCKSVPGRLATYTECQPWWEKHMTYKCAGTSYNFGDAAHREGNIEATATLDTTGLHYTDAIRDSNGNWTYPTGTIPKSPVMDGTQATCEFACKTKKPWTDTSASGATTRASTNLTTQEYMIFIKRCTSDGCPVDAASGEVLVNDCQCIHDFIEGATALDIIGNAASDMICSNGMTSNP
jgi:hypothetical protein